MLSLTSRSTDPLRTNEAVPLRWYALSKRLVKGQVWDGLSKILEQESLQVPKEVEDIYESIERSTSVKLEDNSRKLVYKEFMRVSAKSFGEPALWEVESLIQSDAVARELGIQHTTVETRSKLVRDCLGKCSARLNLVQKGAVDFEAFAHILYDILEAKERLRRFTPLHSSTQSWPAKEPCLQMHQPSGEWVSSEILPQRRC